jgi:hypothetical protein
LIKAKNPTAGAESPRHELKAEVQGRGAATKKQPVFGLSGIKAYCYHGSASLVENVGRM